MKKGANQPIAIAVFGLAWALTIEKKYFLPGIKLVNRRERREGA